MAKYKYKTADEIAELFAHQQPRTSEGRLLNSWLLTRKQANWLLSQFMRENRDLKGANGQQALGTLEAARWECQMLPNGTAIFRLFYY